MAIINTTPQNEAIMSNVGEIGEFRIRNSAKAFNILSSGLYANKIRAIVRELSCNAVDSHTAAGKSDVPFDVHLPNQLEPWFAIRDYGTGLSHDQVTNIYTTYFESTKTDSNDFIGALGLGSKSPFSYTDNFTVTAVKAGVKGIYTAFINDQGVPSIALMTSEASDEPTGVEVKFAVNDRWDFDKFRQEAREVYTYFKLRPVVSGVSDFQFRDVEYETKDIIPGVHSYQGGHRRSVAIMGNIAYPIEIPNADQSLGDLRHLIGCGLELHFAIGELDFQASREGLSYIPQTVEAIKRKLIAVNDALAIVVTKEADAIDNLWDRALHLYKKYHNGLWSAAVKKYVADTKLPTFDDSRYGGTKTFKMGIDDIAKKYNITVRGFKYSRSNKVLPNLKNDTEYGDRNAQGHMTVTAYWGINVSSDVQFVINDGKVGAVERAKYHWRTTKPDASSYIYVLDKADKAKDMNTKAFFKAICNPPKSNIQMASDLTKKERANSGLGKNVTILRLEERGNGGYYREREMVWRDAGKADSFDDTKTYYFLPLSGFEILSKCGMRDAKEFYNDLKECGLPGLRTDIYGVRKGDMAWVLTQKNWVNIEDHIKKELSKPIDNKLVMSLVLNAVDNYNNVTYNNTIVDAVADDKSPYKVFLNKLKGFEKIRYSESSLKRLCERYAQGVTFNPEAQVEAFRKECHAVQNRYPLLAYMSRVPAGELVEYINMVDTQKGV